MKKHIFLLLTSITTTSYFCNSVEDSAPKNLSEVLTTRFYKTYTANNQGEKTAFLEELEASAAKSRPHIRVTYNKEGQVIKDEFFDTGGQRTNYTKYLYKHGHKTHEEFYTSPHTLHSIRQFNKRGQLIKESTHQVSGTQHIHYQYDKNGLLITETYKNANGATLFYKKHSHTNTTTRTQIYTASGQLINTQILPRFTRRENGNNATPSPQKPKR